jgi:hypothetical protein
MQHWWWAAIPIIAGGLGYLARRFLERRHRAEALKRKLQALALHQGMKREGLSMQDLERVEREASS